MRFDDAPLLVIWEMTKACDLACVHCRASAAPQRHSSELTTEEACRLLEAVKEFGNPLMVFTGGDPLKRPDLLALLRRSVALGLRTNISPSAAPSLTRDVIRQFRDCGVARMAISVDGADAAAHDVFRGVPGTLYRAMEALEEAQRVGLDTQLETAVARRNRHQLEGIAGLAAKAGARIWSVFFLVATGRARADDDLTAEEYEEVFETLYEISMSAPFEIKTTEALHYRRYLARRMREHPEPAYSQRTVWRTAGVSDGRGFVFISHAGEIYPSGFLPISAGNVRVDSLAHVYRNSPLFLELRDADARHGKCGEYRKLCGGSRARAYDLTGDYMAADPRCAYRPSCAGSEADCTVA
jgi:AdoMet-dependent heme synthase